MNPIYKFYLNVGGADIEVLPIYSGDLAKEYELESNQKFYRAKLSGKISFIKEDYDLVNNAPFDTEIKFYIYQSNDFGITYFRYMQSSFVKTDCEFNDDDKKVTVQPTAFDQYNDVLKGIEKEYNLIELAPTMESVVIQKRPLIQVYIPGDNVISCFLSGTYWEQECNVVTSENQLINTYYFAQASFLKNIVVEMGGSAIPSDDVSGNYAGKAVKDENGRWVFNASSRMYREDGQYYILYFDDEFHIFRTSDNQMLYETFGYYDIDTPESINFHTTVSSPTYFRGIPNNYYVYMRYLLDTITITDSTTKPTYPIPADDIIDNNLNYRRVIGYDANLASIYQQTSVNPTKWGKRDDGRYYLQPYSFYSQAYYPISRRSWGWSSLWFSFMWNDNYLEKSGRQPFVLKDAFPLSSVIQVLLNQFAPGITHEETTEYSQFLYNQYNPISGDTFHLMITQKSNILSGYYDNPAQKAPITLQDVTNMLRDVYQCYWYIEDNKFKIEHVIWFKNGGSYSYDPIIGTDLTQLENIRNGKTWDFAKNKWSFDRVDMPDRYEFSWMDDVTTYFDGFPIEIKSKYVTPGKIESVSISKFTSDVDYMLLNPTAINKDGFALLAAIHANILDFGYAYSNVQNGRILENGNVSYNPPDGDGTGWGYMKIPCNEEMVYTLRLASGQAIDNIVCWNFYDKNGNSMGRYFWKDYEVITPKGCVQLGMSWRNSVNGVPSNINYLPNYNILGLYESAYSLPFVERQIGGSTVVMQNGLLSLYDLQPKYWTYDLPARNVLINEVQALVQGIQRLKKQQVEFPSINDPDPVKLIKTGLGSGQIEKLSVNLSSRMNKITLKYDTE